MSRISLQLSHFLDLLRPPVLPSAILLGDLPISTVSQILRVNSIRLNVANF